MMAIEKMLGPNKLPKYRSWKKEIRHGLSNISRTASLAISEKSLNRYLDKNFSPLFICGISGSGTTLLSALLEQNYENGFSLRESDRHPQAPNLLAIKKTESYDGFAEYKKALFLPSLTGIKKIKKSKLTLYRRVADYPKSSNNVLDKAANSHMVRIGNLLGSFPRSRAVLVYRDPVQVIEGLIRKWPKIFSIVSVKELSDFWVELHAHFFTQSQPYSKLRSVFSYNDLIKSHERVIANIADQQGLVKRIVPLKLKDKKNEPGKGIRNVIEGKIEIIKDAGKDSRKTLGKENAREIQSICSEMYEKLEQANELSL